MNEIKRRIPCRDGHRGYRTYTEDERGGFRDKYGNHWSPPIRKLTKQWRKLPVFEAFGPAILASAERLEWRAQIRHRRVERVTAYYPGFTPADRAAQKDFRLYVDVNASPLTGNTVTWFDHLGKYTFTSEPDQPAAAVHMLEHAIERVLTMGAAIAEASDARLGEPGVGEPGDAAPTTHGRLPETS